MANGNGQRWKIIAAAIVLLWAADAVAQRHTPRYRPARQVPAILSTSRPTDSLGETVYEMPKPNQSDVPPLAGVFMTPVVLQTVDPRYPESMRKAHKDGEVVVEGVVSKDGRFIDINSVSASDPGFVKSAVDAASGYIFQPATLDGKPVACLLRVEVTWRML